MPQCTSLKIFIATEINFVSSFRVAKANKFVQETTSLTITVRLSAFLTQVTVESKKWMR
jgi:hypothetical protein